MSDDIRTSEGLSPPPFGPDWAFFLDVDGTLLDLAATPTAVTVDERIRRLLLRLQQLTGGALALISGRSAADIDRLFAPQAYAIAGQHGVERRDASGGWHRHRLPEKGIKAAVRELEALCRANPGLVFEDKGVNLAVHYRLAPALGHAVHETMRALLPRLGPRFEIQGGKMLWEIKPSGRDKGMTLEEFLAEAPFAGRTPVFLGDDVTDESAFKAVNRRGGHSIKVGPGATHARFRLPDAEAVRRWLESWADWASQRA